MIQILSSTCTFFIFHLYIFVLLQITFMESRLITRIRVVSSSAPQTVLLSMQLKIQRYLFVLEIIFPLIPICQILILLHWLIIYLRLAMCCSSDKKASFFLSIFFSFLFSPVNPPSSG